MATESVAIEPVTMLPLELRPDVEHLITEDDTPVDNLFSEKQQRLLTDPLYASWPGPGTDRPFLAMANVGLFYSVERTPFVPDMLCRTGISTCQTGRGPCRETGGTTQASGTRAESVGPVWDLETRELAAARSRNKRPVPLNCP